MVLESRPNRHAAAGVGALFALFGLRGVFAVGGIAAAGNGRAGRVDGSIATYFLLL